MLTLLLSLFSLEAQQLPNDCASTGPCNAQWRGPFQAYDETIPYQGGAFIVSIRCYKRECSGEVQYMIDWNDPLTYLTFEEFFNTGEFFEKDFSGKKEYMEFTLLKLSIESNSGTVPNCTAPNAPKVMVDFYTARCGVWVKCGYKVDISAPVQRDDYYQGDCPSPIPHQGQPYIDVWKWQPCGTTCCKKRYELCKEFDHTLNKEVIRIRNVQRMRAPGFACSEQGNCRDWRTNREYQCQDGCDGN